MKTHIKDFPDLGNSAKLLKISVELENKVQNGGIIGMAIYSGLRKGNIKEVIKMIRGQAEDNRPMMEEIIGNELLNDILTVKI